VITGPQSAGFASGPALTERDGGRFFDADKAICVSAWRACLCAMDGCPGWVRSLTKAAKVLQEKKVEQRRRAGSDGPSRRSCSLRTQAII
jgi:hypothetical protein